MFAATPADMRRPNRLPAAGHQHARPSRWAGADYVVIPTRYTRATIDAFATTERGHADAFLEMWALSISPGMCERVAGRWWPNESRRSGTLDLGNGISKASW